MAEPESGQPSSTAPTDEVVSSAKQRPPAAQDGLPSIGVVLAASRLGWTKAQQAAVREKLSAAGIESFDDLAESLNVVGHLNGLLRSSGRTAFRESTLQSLRSLCLEFKETSRMQQRWRLQKQKEDRTTSQPDAEADAEAVGSQKPADDNEGEHADQAAGAPAGRRWGRAAPEARTAAASTAAPPERVFMEQEDELTALTKLLRGLACEETSQDEDASCQGAASDTEPSTTASVAEHAEHAAAPASSTSEEASSSSGTAPQQPMVLLKTGRFDRPAREKPVVIE